MPTKSTLVLKSSVTKRQAEPIPSDMAERLEQLKHHQSAENAAVRPNEAATAVEPEKPGKDLKPVPHALQAVFLIGNLGKPVTVTTRNNIRVTGKLRQFDQYCLLLEGPDGLNSLLFKHAITTVMPASAAPGKSRTQNSVRSTIPPADKMIISDPTTKAQHEPTTLAH